MLLHCSGGEVREVGRYGEWEGRREEWRKEEGRKGDRASCADSTSPKRLVGEREGRRKGGG